MTIENMTSLALWPDILLLDTTDTAFLTAAEISRQESCSMSKTVRTFRSLMKYGFAEEEQEMARHFQSIQARSDLNRCAGYAKEALPSDFRQDVLI